MRRRILFSKHLDLELNPEGPGELRMGKLQIPSRPAWSNLSAQTSYANKNFILTASSLIARSDSLAGDRRLPDQSEKPRARSGQLARGRNFRGIDSRLAKSALRSE